MPDRVLLIGNGPSAAKGGLGREVDDFAGVVARFNDFRIAGFEEHLGSRTDEWITWQLFGQPAQHEYDRVLCVDRPPAETWPAVKARFPHARRLTPDDVEATIARMGYEHPSSGALAAMAYLRAGWEIVLHGFDFFQAPSHHYADKAPAGPKHSGTRELLFFQDLFSRESIRLLDPAAATPAAATLGTEGTPAAIGGELSRVLAMLWEENRRLLRLAQECTSQTFKIESDLAASWRDIDRAVEVRSLGAAAKLADEQAVRQHLEAQLQSAQEASASLQARITDLEARAAGLEHRAAAATHDAVDARAHAAQAHHQAREAAGRIAILAEEVLRLRAALGRQTRVNLASAQAVAAEVADHKRRAAGAAWAREALTRRLESIVDRR